MIAFPGKIAEVLSTSTLLLGKAMTLKLAMDIADAGAGEQNRGDLDGSDQFIELGKNKHYTNLHNVVLRCDTPPPVVPRLPGFSFSPATYFSFE